MWLVGFDRVGVFEFFLLFIFLKFYSGGLFRSDPSIVYP